MMPNMLYPQPQTRRTQTGFTGSVTPPLTRLHSLRDKLAFFGAHPVPAAPVLEEIELVIAAINAGSTRTHGDGWISLTTAKRRSGKSEAWFRAPLDLLGGQSRLQAWAAQGLAKQEGRQWFVTPSVVPERAAVEIAPSRNAVSPTNHDGSDGALDTEALYRQMQAIKRSR